MKGPWAGAGITKGGILSRNKRGVYIEKKGEQREIKSSANHITGSQGLEDEEEASAQMCIKQGESRKRRTSKEGHKKEVIKKAAADHWQRPVILSGCEQLEKKRWVEFVVELPSLLSRLIKTDDKSRTKALSPWM